MRRVALYIRVSSQEQKMHGLSIDSQIEELKRYASDNNLFVVGYYNDAGISARKNYKKRPELLRMLDDCKQGKIDLILFTKLDRWFRNVADYYEVQKILDDAGVKWRAIQEDYETETSSGVFKVNIMLSVAQSEADRTSERIASVFEYKRQQGHHIGSVPLGYKRVDGKLQIDPETEPAIRAMFRTYLSTFSSQKARLAGEEHGVVRATGSVTRILKKPVYAGEINGVKVPAYITKGEHELIIRRLKTYVRKPKSDNLTYLFSGLCFCEHCGCRLHAGHTASPLKSGGKVITQWYYCHGNEAYRTHDGTVYVGERKLEKYLLSQFDDIVKEYNIALDAKPNHADSSLKKNRLRQKLDRIGIRYEDGDISTEDYRRKRSEILIQIADIEKAEAPASPIVIPSNWRDMYQQLDTSHKRAFWSSFIESITFTSDKTIAPHIKLAESHD